MDVNYEFKKTFFNTHIQLLLRQKEIKENEKIEQDLDEKIDELKIEQANLKRRLRALNKPSNEASSSGNQTKYGIDVLRLCVKYLNPKTTEETLHKYFSDYGKIEDISLPHDKHDKTKNRTYAFITFASFKKFPLDFKHVVDQKNITVTKLEPHNGTQKTNYLLATGVLNSLTEKDLIKYFAKYGTILGIQKERKKFENYKVRFAYIKYANAESVEDACKQTIHEIKNQLVDVRKCHEDEIHFHKY